MRIALLQLNPTVGALDDNALRIEAAVTAVRGRVDVCVTPEMALTGYPPRDLLLIPGFIARAQEVAARLARVLADGPDVLVGMPVPSGVEAGRPLLNAGVHLRGGAVGEAFAKTLLPTYDVFDEDRYFEPGRAVGAVTIGDRRAAVSICEDVWNDPDVWTTRRYDGDPMAALRDRRHRSCSTCRRRPMPRTSWPSGRGCSPTWHASTASGRSTPTRSGPTTT